MTLEESVNIARRLSVKNEPDLLQEEMVSYTKEECEKMVLALSGSLSRLPVECRPYVGSRKTSTPETAVDPFAGMYSGQRAAAKTEQFRGRPTHAVLQRKYTKSNR